jgi:hypothetical protein
MNSIKGISFVLYIQLTQTDRIQVQHLKERVQHLCHSEYLHPETNLKDDKAVAENLSLPHGRNLVLPIQC